MRGSARRMGANATIAGLLIAVISLAVWFSPTVKDNPAQANHGVVAIGIDTNTTGNSALALSGSFENCRAISVGQIIEVDLYVTALDDLASWEAYIKYDNADIEITQPGTDNNERFQLQQAQPSPPGNSVVNTSEPLPDTANPGIYRVGAYDQVVIAGLGDPDPIGHTHKDGVLVRLELKGLASGFSQLRITPFTSGPGLVGPFLRDSFGASVEDGNSDGFIDNVTNGGIVVGGTCTDGDSDGVPDSYDNCPSISNQNQENFDGDTLGDACDNDDDNDGLLDTSDGSPPNPPSECQFDPDCDNDLVSDGGNDPDAGGPIVAGPDNCIAVANGPAQAGIPGVGNQTNTDGAGDGGDACDPDDDNDGFLDGPDNCDQVFNNPQTDTDGDGQGDACDTEDDGDGFSDTAEAYVGTNSLDNCGEPNAGGWSNSWPADLAVAGPSANKITLTDVSSYIAPVRRIQKSPGDPGYHIRWDVVPGTTIPGGKHINLIDISTITTFKPLMFGGSVRAFGYPTPCTP